MKWQTHTTKLIQKIKRNQHLLRLSQNILNIQTLKMLYYAQIFSHINYGIGIWGNHVNKQMLRKLQKLQNKCLSYLLHCRRINNKDYEKLEILKINEIITLENLKFGYKYYHDHLSHEINKNVLHDQHGHSLRKTHHYNTRGKNNLTIPLVKNHLTLFKQYIMQKYTGIQHTKGRNQISANFTQLCQSM